MERKEVEAKYKWHTEDIFPSDEAWELGYEKAGTYLDFSHFAGKLGDPSAVRALFDAQERAGRALERLYLYAHMKHDEDTRDGKYTAMQSRAMALYVRYSAETAFVEPELSALDDCARWRPTRAWRRTAIISAASSAKSRTSFRPRKSACSPRAGRCTGSSKTSFP